MRHYVSALQAKGVSETPPAASRQPASRIAPFGVSNGVQPPISRLSLLLDAAHFRLGAFGGRNPSAFETCHIVTQICRHALYLLPVLTCRCALQLDYEVQVVKANTDSDTVGSVICQKADQVRVGAWAGRRCISISMLIFACGLVWLPLCLPEVGIEVVADTDMMFREWGGAGLSKVQSWFSPLGLRLLLSIPPQSSLAGISQIKPFVVVMARHAKGALKEFFVGSVTRYALSHCGRPVCVMHCD